MNAFRDFLEKNTRGDFLHLTYFNLFSCPGYASVNRNRICLQKVYTSYTPIMRKHQRMNEQLRVSRNDQQYMLQQVQKVIIA